MFNWCAKLEYKMSDLFVFFSDLGRILRLLLLQSGYRYRTKVLGWLLQTLMLEFVCSIRSRVTLTFAICRALLANSYNPECCHTYFRYGHKS